MSVGDSGSRDTRPGHARRVMDELESRIEGATSPPAVAAEIHQDDDWAPAVPGCEEPPD